MGTQRTIEKRDRARWLPKRAVISWLPWVAPVVVLLSMALPGISQGDWQQVDGSWYAAIASQAWRTGELWTFKGVDGLPYFNKPPLVFWISGLVLHMGGVSTVTVRAPAVFAAVFCTLLTVAIARLWADRTMAAVSGCVLAFTIELTRRTHEISLDIWQLLFMLVSVWLVMLGVRRQRAWLVIASGVPIGLALMCKPFVALVAPVIMVVWMLPRSRRGLVWAELASIVVALAVATPWHLSMILQHGQTFTGQYFGSEVVNRAMGEVDAVKPVYFYFSQFLKRYWPWLPLAVIGIVGVLRGGPAVRTRPVLWASLCWIVIWLAVVTAFPDRRDRYVIPVYPFLSIVIGWWLCARGRRQRHARRVALAAVVITPVVGAVIALTPVRIHGSTDRAWIELMNWLRDRDPKQIWQGAFNGHRSARVYNEFGYWPRATRDPLGAFIIDRETTPPVGAYLLYFRRDGLLPGPNEEKVFESGSVCVTQLQSPGWAPVPFPDPGEGN